MRHCLSAGITLALIGTVFNGSTNAQTPPQADVLFGSMAGIAVPAYSDSQKLEVRVDVYKMIGMSSRPSSLRFLNWTTDSSKLRATFVSDKAFVEDFLGYRPSDYAIPLPPLSPGSYTVELATSDGKVTATNQLTVASTGPTIAATSLGNRRSGKFFLTAAPAEASALLALFGASTPTIDEGGVHWGVAERAINVWPATGNAPAEAQPVCRLYHPQVATHFYSANATDCATIRRTAPWVDEGVAFRALTAKNGVCPVGTDPVYRLFNPDLANHVYTRSTASVAAFAQTGWANEGVVFCSPKN